MATYKLSDYKTILFKQNGKTTDLMRVVFKKGTTSTVVWEKIVKLVQPIIVSVGDGNGSYTNIVVRNDNKVQVTCYYGDNLSTTIGANTSTTIQAANGTSWSCYFGAYGYDNTELVSVQGLESPSKYINIIGQNSTIQILNPNKDIDCICHFGTTTSTELGNFTVKANNIVSYVLPQENTSYYFWFTANGRLNSASRQAKPSRWAQPEIRTYWYSTSQTQVQFSNNADYEINIKVTENGVEQGSITSLFANESRSLYLDNGYVYDVTYTSVAASGSATDKIYPIAAPTLSAGSTAGSISIKPSTYGTGADIYRFSSKIGTLGTSSSSTYTDTGFNVGDTETYRLHKNGFITSAPSSYTVKSAGTLIAPSITTYYSDTTYTQVVVRNNNNVAVTLHYGTSSSSSSTTTISDNSSSTFYRNNGTHFYAYFSATGYTNSSEVHITPLIAPRYTAKTSNSITLTNDNDSSYSYSLYRNGTRLTSSFTGRDTYVDSGLSPNTQYNYVLASDGYISSTAFAVSTNAATQLKAPSLSTEPYSNGKQTRVWVTNNNSGVSVTYKYGSSSSSLTNSTTSNPITWTNGSSFYIKATATGYSDSSVASLSPVTAPTSTTKSASSITIKNNDNLTCNLWRDDTSSSLSTVASGNTYTNTSLTSGTTYRYYMHNTKKIGSSVLSVTTSSSGGGCGTLCKTQISSGKCGVTCRASLNVTILCGDTCLNSAQYADPTPPEQPGIEETTEWAQQQDVDLTEFINSLNTNKEE